MKKMNEENERQSVQAANEAAEQYKNRHKKKENSPAEKLRRIGNA